MTVYIDVLFAVNFIINLFLLLCTGFILRFRASILRLICGALISALYSVLMFFPAVHIMYTLFGRAAFTILLVMLFYKKRRPFEIIKAVLAFVTVSFIFFGFIYAYSACFGGGGILISNGVVYADISVIKLLIAAAAAVAVAKCFIALSDRNMSRRKIIYDAEVTILGKTENIKILCDTGCELTEPLSGQPVILISESFKPSDLGEGERYTGVKTAMSSIAETVPLHRAQKIVLKSDTTAIDCKKCYIGYTEGFSPDGLYDAIAGPDAFYETDINNKKISFGRSIKQMIEYINSEGKLKYLFTLPRRIKEVILKSLARITAGGAHYIGGADTLPAPYTKEEESYWIGELSNPENCENAVRKLTEHNLRLVVYIAKKFDSTGIGIEDLISIGTIGLIKAINTFKPEKNIKLATYASRCIENEILMYLRKNSNGKNEVSIDEPLNVDWDGNELLLSDILGTDSDVTQKNLEDETDRKLLKIAMDKLSRRERNIVELRFGINNRGEEKTQKEVADILGISQSYISRLEKRIIGRLRCDMNRMINS